LSRIFIGPVWVGGGGLAKPWVLWYSWALANRNENKAG
jgi:hypothetical protein